MKRALSLHGLHMYPMNWMFRRTWLSLMSSMWRGNLWTGKSKFSSVWRNLDELLQIDVVVLKKIVLQGSPSNADACPKVRVPEPKGLSGNCNAKELGNFLWDMEQFFKAAHVPDSEKVSITNIYLMGDAKLWWRTRVREDLEAARPQVVEWEMLKKELKDQFLRTNARWLVRESLKRLKHIDSVQDYVKEFSSLMLNIRNMSDEDKLFNFISGL